MTCNHFSHFGTANQPGIAKVRLGGAAAALRERLKTPLSVGEREELERVLGEPREAMPATWEEGRVMPLDKVVGFALGD